MFLQKKIKKLFFLIYTVAVSCKCDEEEKSSKLFNYSKSEIIADKFETKNLIVDVYLDGTTSMKGFVTGKSTNFKSLIEDIEGISQNLGTNTEISFYKYGKSVKPISREQFIGVRTDSSIYSDKAFRIETNIDSAIAKVDSKRLSILITDMFFKDDDRQRVVSSIQNQCFKRGLSMSISLLTSDFDGWVGDVNPPVKVNGQRPLYVVAFGGLPNLQLLQNGLKSKAYVNAEMSMLITGKPVKSYQFEITKTKESKALNKSSYMKKEVEKHGNIFPFSWKEENEQMAEFDLKLAIEILPGAFIPNVKDWKLVSHRKSDGQIDSVEVDDDEIKIQNLESSSINRFKGKLILKRPATEFNHHFYKLVLEPDNTARISLPEWVKNISTSDFKANTNLDKTLNLDKLISDLITNSLTNLKPKVAKFYVVLENKF